MNDFNLPAKQPASSDPFNQMPPSLPPKHKKSKASPITSDEKNTAEESEEAEHARMLEEYPIIVPEPGQCDWHLGTLFAGNYPDPFSLPVLEYAEHSLIHANAALLYAIDQAEKEKSAVKKTSDETAE